MGTHPRWRMSSCRRRTNQSTSGLSKAEVAAWKPYSKETPPVATPPLADTTAHIFHGSLQFAETKHDEAHLSADLCMESTASSVATSLFSDHCTISEALSVFASSARRGMAQGRSNHMTKDTSSSTYVTSLEQELAHLRKLVKAQTQSASAEENWNKERSQLVRSARVAEEENKKLRVIATHLQNENRELRSIVQNFVGSE